MKPILLLLLSTLYLTGCDAWTAQVDDPTETPEILNAVVDNNEQSEQTEQQPATVENVAESEPEIVDSLIEGNVTLLNNTGINGNINIQVRGTEISTFMSASKDFSLAIPISDVEREIALDFTGDTIVRKSVLVIVPADSQRVLSDAYPYSGYCTCRCV